MNLLLSKCGIIIKPNLGIGGNQIPIGIFGQRIHFDHGAILIDK
jgi:hypothetical protein